MSAECIFCRIVAGQAPARLVYQDEWVTAFHDIRPVAPVHVLLVPNQHIATMNEVTAAEADWMAHLMLAVPEVARRVGVDVSGYRLVINVGRDGRQEILHVHMHLLGGQRLPVSGRA